MITIVFGVLTLLSLGIGIYDEFRKKDTVLRVEVVEERDGRYLDIHLNNFFIVAVVLLLITLLTLIF